MSDNQWRRQYAAGLMAWVVSALFAAAAAAQFTDGGVPNSSAGGVYIDNDGTVRVREKDVRDELNQARTRAKNAGKSAREETLAYVSLPKLFAEVRRCAREKKPIPDELRYLHGMTQVRYVFVYPETGDLVIAGPSEPWDAANAFQPVGKKSGRPALVLDDLIVAMRTAKSGGKSPFGCTIDNPPDAMQKAHDVMQKHGRGTPGQIMEQMRNALGDQTVKVFGTAEDTRTAFICVAADYKLKRLSLGIDPSPVPGLASAVDNSRAAGNRFWFETSYEPLLMSPDGNAFEIRGQRLLLKCGALSFDEKGATETAKNWAKQFTAKMPALAAGVPLFADLQNIADWSLVATLIRLDKLDQKAGWDTAFVLDTAACPVMKAPVPRTAETLVSTRNGSIVAGGVIFGFMQWVEPSARRMDDKETLAPAREASSKALKFGGTTQPAM